MENKWKIQFQERCISDEKCFSSPISFFADNCLSCADFFMFVFLNCQTFLSFILSPGQSLLLFSSSTLLPSICYSSLCHVSHHFLFSPFHLLSHFGYFHWHTITSNMAISIMIAAVSWQGFTLLFMVPSHYRLLK